MCRHRIAVVLAYQQTPEEAADSGEVIADWSPGEFDDEALAAAFGRPALAAARRTRARGFTARLHRPTPDAPTPRADLPSCTVSFPVPHEPAYALTDAAESVRGEVVTLAVWAFRAGDTEGTDQVSVGGRTAAGTAAEDDGVRPDRHPTATTGHAPATPTAAQPANATARHHAATVTPSPPASPGGPGADPLRGAVALADELLLDGVRQAGPVFGAALRRSQDALAGARLHWPAGAVAELREQVEAYAARGTRYDPERFARLLAELHARQRAGGRDPGAVLGTEEAPSTPLRRVRLVALGCRIGGSDRDRTAETYFAHPDAAIVLVLRKRWESAEGQEPTGHDLAGRRLLGAPLRALAAANVVSERTARSADRTITVSRGRIAAAGVTPVGSAWTELPEALLLRDAAAHLRSLGEGPPRLVRPRVEAESVRVVEVAAVAAVGYDPARQVLEAVLRDPAGTEVVVRAEHNPLCPARLDALAAAFGDGGAGPVRWVSGMLHRDRGRIVLDPLAVLTPAGVVVPDLAPGEGAGALPPAAATPADPLTGALTEALAALADAAHHGLRHLAPAARGRLAGAADRLHRTGLHTAARHLRALAAALRDQGLSAAPPVWVTAYVRLSATLEAHQESRPA
ncbi:hypothetical protein [Actinacidiphila epipremni]|uniref:Uncharacterized protein n=1 Tax=Actinacidiphila epipremni TaxID=2053013 RepID=A0ABX0ZQI0_9ACTN|nr:hypothetical protein [Actinacidiphila epipremni]NJP45272.1 hypothetical protein [Actinacidiphila epipremni]